MSTAVIGISTIEQLEEAAAANKGQLPATVYAQLGAVWDGFAGDACARERSFHDPFYQ